MFVNNKMKMWEKQAWFYLLSQYLHTQTEEKHGISQTLNFVTMMHCSEITFLDIIHRPDFLSHGVSVTGFCLCLQVISTLLSPIDRASPYL